MITYDTVHKGEEEVVKSLWKSEQVALGIPYMSDIQDYIDSNALYCIRDNGKIVAYCTYYVMKTKPVVRIEALVVAPEYRGKGYSKQLIYKCYLENNNLIDKLGYSFQAESKEGVPNNTFYDRISTNMTSSQKKTCVIRTYDLDVDKIKSWGPDMWSTHCPNPNGEEGICYAYDRLGDRTGCINCPYLDTLPNGLFNEGDPLPGLTAMLQKENKL